MSKIDIRKASGTSPNTMTKLHRGEPVMLNVLDKICKTLDSTTGTSLTILPDEERSDKS